LFVIAFRNELVPLMNDIAQRDVVPLIVRTAEITRDDQRYLDDVAQVAWSDKKSRYKETFSASIRRAASRD
jgi:hypothetical protein